MKNKKLVVRDYDAAEFLGNEKAIAAYLDEVFKDGNDDDIKRALADVARARNMTDIAGKNERQPSVAIQISVDRNADRIWNNPQFPFRRRRSDVRDTDNLSQIRPACARVRPRRHLTFCGILIYIYLLIE